MHDISIHSRLFILKDFIEFCFHRGTFDTKYNEFQVNPHRLTLDFNTSISQITKQ